MSQLEKIALAIYSSAVQKAGELDDEERLIRRSFVAAKLFLKVSRELKKADDKING